MLQSVKFTSFRVGKLCTISHNLNIQMANQKQFPIKNGYRYILRDTIISIMHVVSLLLEYYQPFSGILSHPSRNPPYTTIISITS